MRTYGVLVLCAILIASGHGAPPVEKRRESTKEILELESLLKKSAGEDKKIFSAKTQQEAKEKEAKLAAESEAKEGSVDLPLIPPQIQVDGLAEKDELEAQLHQQQKIASQLDANQDLDEKGNDNGPSKEESEEVNEEVLHDGKELDEDQDSDDLDAEKREQDLFVRYLRESPELWKRFMDSLEYNTDAWNEERNIPDEYPAVMQEWKNAMENNIPQYVPQYPQFDDSYVPQTGEWSESNENLENELPQMANKFSNLEDLQSYYNDNLAREVSKKRGYGRPKWVDDENTISEDDIRNSEGEVDDEPTELHKTDEESQLLEHPIM